MEQSCASKHRACRPRWGKAPLGTPSCQLTRHHPSRPPGPAVCAGAPGPPTGRGFRVSMPADKSQLSHAPTGQTERKQGTPRHKRTQACTHVHMCAPMSMRARPAPERQATGAGTQPAVQLWQQADPRLCPRSRLRHLTRPHWLQLSALQPGHCGEQAVVPLQSMGWHMARLAALPPEQDRPLTSSSPEVQAMAPLAQIRAHASRTAPSSPPSPAHHCLLPSP